MKFSFHPLQNKLHPLAAVMASLIAAVVLVTVAATPIYLKSSGAFSTKQHIMYIAGTATVATIFTAFITSQVQALLLLQIDRKLQKASVTDQFSVPDELNRRWRVILKIGSLKEIFQNPEVGIIYLLTSLITTAIVTGLTPDLTTRRYPYSPKISYGPNGCCRTQPLSDVEMDGREYYWDLGNGSAFFIPANAGGCPTRYATVLAANINPVNPDVFAYADGGVEILGSAVGTPLSIYSSQPNIAPDFNTLLGMYGLSVVSTTQCVPVMRKNPITCQRGGTITLGSSQMNLTSSDGRCSHNAELPFLNPLTDNTMGSIMCAYGEVGQGTIVMGASGSFVKWLASFLGDHDYPHPTDDGDLGNGGDWAGYSYTVTCTVDARDVWEYRTVTLTLQDPHTSDPSYARSLQGYEPCDPIPGTSAINDCLIGTSAAANWQILNQNAGIDGHLDLLGDLTVNWRLPPYGFNNSMNALEDALGLISAIVASRINSSTVAVDGTVVVTATTIGSRKAFAFLFIIPPVAVAFVLSCLIVATPQPKDTSEGKSCKSAHLLGGVRRNNENTARDEEAAGVGEAAGNGEAARDGDAARDGEAVRVERTQETERLRETDTEQETEMGQETERDRDNLLLHAAPPGQSPHEEQAQ